MKNKFQEFYERELKAKFLDLETKRRHLYRRRKYFIPLFILNIVLLFVFIKLINEPPATNTIVLLVPFLFYVFTILSIQSLKIASKDDYEEYRDYFKQEIVTNIVYYIHFDAKYEPKKHISKRDFIASFMFFPKGFDYSGDDMVYGKIGQTPFWFSELKVSLEMKSKKNFFFKGLFFIADFNKNMNCPLLICPHGKNARKDVFPNGFRVENFENTDFEKLFSVYCKNDLTARYVLTPDFIERILKLNKIAKTQISLSIVGSYIYIALPYSTDLFEPSLKKNKNGFKKAWEILSFMHRCFYIVKLLDLNTRIWTKE